MKERCKAVGIKSLKKSLIRLGFVTNLQIPFFFPFDYFIL